MAVVASVAALIAGALLVLWVTGMVPPTIYIDAGTCGPYYFHVTYLGAREGYLFPNATNIPCSDPVVHLQEPAGGAFTNDWTFHNSDRSSTHSITGVSVASPWGCSGTSPALPISVPPGGNVSLTFKLSYPDTPGVHYDSYYSLTLTSD